MKSYKYYHGTKAQVFNWTVPLKRKKRPILIHTLLKIFKFLKVIRERYINFLPIEHAS